MTMQMWAYLWDIATIGVDKALDEMQSIGISGVSVATSYHAGRFIQPRMASHVYYPEDGTVHVPLPVVPGLIQPLMSRFAHEHPDLIDCLSDAAQRRGMTVASWTVMLHNTRLGTLHPALTVKNAFGDPLVWNLCPSNPDVRQYTIGMVKAPVDRHHFSGIEVESLGYMGIVHEFHHEKDGVGLNLSEQLLMSLCFCERCMAGARQANVDVDEARRYARNMLSNAFMSETPRLTMTLEELWNVPALRPYWAWHTLQVHSLIRDIKAVLPVGTELRVLDLFGPQLSRFYGLDYSRVLYDADAVCLCFYEKSIESVRADAARMLATVGQSDRVGAGYRLLFPEMRSREDFLAKTLAARDAGISSFYFYNYGLVPSARLDWVRAFKETEK